MWGGVRKPQARDRQGSDLPELERGVEWSGRIVVSSDAEVLKILVSV